MTAMKLTSATFNSALKGLRLPSRKKLVGEYLLGGTQAESVKNRANPSKPLTVQGAPTYNANSVVVRSHASAGFGFTTGIIPSDDATLIVVRKNATIGSQPQIVGISDAVFTDGFWGVREYATFNWGSNGEGAPAYGASRAKPTSGTVYFEALTLSRKNLQSLVGGYGKLYYYSAGAQQVSTSANLIVADRRSMYQRQISIGTTNLTDSVNNNNLEVYFVAIYQRTLSPAEIDAAYQAIVAYYAARGVVVS